MVLIFIALIGIVFSYATHKRTKVWTNADTLWKNVMDQYPSPPYKIAETYQANLGNSFGEKGQEFQRIGDQVQAMEMYKKSIMYFSNVLLTDSNSVPMLINRALVYELIQNYDLALEDYSKALLIEPLNMDLRERRANSLYKLNKAEEAIMEYNKLIFMDSSRTSLFHYRGIAKFNLGMEKEAIEDFKVIVQRQPLNAKAYYQLSVCYNNINDNANALFYAEKAIQFGLRIDPNYVDSLRNTLKK